MTGRNVAVKFKVIALFGKPTSAANYLYGVTIFEFSWNFLFRKSTILEPPRQLVLLCILGIFLYTTVLEPKAS